MCSLIDIRKIYCGDKHSYEIEYEVIRYLNTDLSVISEANKYFLNNK